MVAEAEEVWDAHDRFNQAIRGEVGRIARLDPIEQLCATCVFFNEWLAANPVDAQLHYEYVAGYRHLHDDEEDWRLMMLVELLNRSELANAPVRHHPADVAAIIDAAVHGLHRRWRTHDSYPDDFQARVLRMVLMLLGVEPDRIADLVGCFATPPDPDR